MKIVGFSRGIAYYVYSTARVAQHWAQGFTFDVLYTSVLQRAIKTGLTILEDMGLLWIPIEKNWRLNERHYGALQVLRGGW